MLLISTRGLVKGTHLHVYLCQPWQVHCKIWHFPSLFSIFLHSALMQLQCHSLLSLSWCVSVLRGLVSYTWPTLPPGMLFISQHISIYKNDIIRLTFICILKSIKIELCVPHKAFWLKLFSRDRCNQSSLM